MKGLICFVNFDLSHWNYQLELADDCIACQYLIMKTPDGVFTQTRVINVTTNQVYHLQ